MVDDFAGVGQERIDLEVVVHARDHVREVFRRERVLLPYLLADGILALFSRLVRGR